MPMAIKFDRVVTYHKWLPPVKSHDHLITWPFKITVKLKPLYLYYPTAYGHQTWQHGNLHGRAPIYKVT